jgi:hypothetical protein
MKKLEPYIDDFVWFFVGYLLFSMLIMQEKLDLDLFLEVSFASAGFSWFFNWMLSRKK